MYRAVAYYCNIWQIHVVRIVAYDSTHCYLKGANACLLLRVPSDNQSRLPVYFIVNCLFGWSTPCFNLERNSIESFASSLTALNWSPLHFVDWWHSAYSIIKTVSTCWWHVSGQVLWLSLDLIDTRLISSDFMNLWIKLVHSGIQPDLLLCGKLCQFHILSVFEIQRFCNSRFNHSISTLYCWTYILITWPSHNSFMTLLSALIYLKELQVIIEPRV